MDSSIAAPLVPPDMELPSAPTPAPWHVSDNGDTSIVEASNGRVVARDLYDEENEPSLGEMKANANLIAAAPDQNKALKEMAHDFSKMINALSYKKGFDAKEALKVLDRGMQALAKARGE